MGVRRDSDADTHRVGTCYCYTPAKHSSGLVEAGALFVPGLSSGTGGSSDDGLTYHLERGCKTSNNTGRAWRDKNDSWTSEHEVRDENLVRGASL